MKRASKNLNIQEDEYCASFPTCRDKKRNYNQMNRNTFVVVIIFLLSPLLSAQQSNDENGLKYGAFSFIKEIKLPGSPEEIFEAATGDISGWWDHSFSENPVGFYIEPIPGGGFWEFFDEEGNGVLHATVIAADRGKLLRFDGPLGLAGTAIQLVITYTFEASGGDSTFMKIYVHGAGEVDDSTPVIVEKVWEHFIFERFKPYVETGENLEN
jgi:uncharacterized protein YndB with AHSA1/START domain